MKRIVIIFISLMLTIPVEAAFTKKDRGTAGAKFLKIGVGARAIGMGEAYTALSDEISAGYWNPAGLTQINRLELTATHNMWLSRFNHDYLGLAYPLMRNNQVIAINVTSLSYDRIKVISTDETIKPSDVSIGLTYARSLGFLNAGITVKSINQKLYKNSMKGIAGDVGLLYRSPLDTVGIGLSALNIGPQIDGDPLPLSIRCGGMLRVGEPFVATADIHAPVDDKVSFHVGSEYTLRITRQLSTSLRMGFKDTLIQDLGYVAGLSAGLGLTWYHVRIDYAFVPYGDLGTTHRVSLGYEFGQRKDERVRAHYDYLKARTLYKKGMFTDAMEILTPYHEVPSRGPKAARLAKATKEKMRESMDPDALYNQAYMFYKKAKFIHSYNLVSEALKINPHHKKAKKLYKIVRRKIITIKKKKKNMIQKEREEHERELVQSLLGRGQRQISRKEYKEAIKTFEKVFRYQPDNKKAEKLMISAQSRLDEQKAKKRVKKQIKRPKKKAAARVTKKAGSAKQAEKLYQQGLQLYTEGKVKKAVEIWKKVLSLSPSHTKARNALRRNGKM